MDLREILWGSGSSITNNYQLLKEGSVLSSWVFLSLFNDGRSTTLVIQRRVGEWSWIMNYGKRGKESWPTLSHYPRSTQRERGNQENPQPSRPAGQDSNLRPSKVPKSRSSGLWCRVVLR
jgi:hypothetical protein